MPALVTKVSLFHSPNATAALWDTNDSSRMYLWPTSLVPTAPRGSWESWKKNSGKTVGFGGWNALEIFYFGFPLSLLRENSHVLWHWKARLPFVNLPQKGAMEGITADVLRLPHKGRTFFFGTFQELENVVTLWIWKVAVDLVKKIPG